MILEISIIVLAVLIDTVYGEVPDKIHPVIYMGNLITKLKNYLPNTKFSGFLITITVMFIFSVVTLLLLLIMYLINIYVFLIVASIILSTTFSIKFLIESVKKIEIDLKKDINTARKSMSYLVSRDTSTLNESEITSAAIETMTENITDSITAVLLYTAFFGLIFNIFIGIIVAVIYRVSNTLDAMLGYKTESLINVGYVPAKLDDILNYIPARITGFFVVLSALILGYDYKQSYDVMRKFANKTPSPNSGYTMAACAGALDVTLVKKDVYTLGYGKSTLNSKKIEDAIKITKLSALLFILTIVIVYVLLYIILFI